MKRRMEKENKLEEGSGEVENHEHLEQGDIRGDERSIAILFFLYLLQGIPLGLSAAIPMLLQNRSVSYRQQAEFSLVNWPFSLKLFWAPIVDSVYLRKFGRRKTWLVPIQYLMGLFMLFLSGHVDKWIGNEAESLNIGLLTMLFFSLNLLAATQDIVVDGWALTMLKRCNVGYASTCNSVGQTAGYFLGYVLFMALESAKFCNDYLRSEPSDEGLLTLPGFLYFWGWVFIVTTTLIALLKHEHSRSNAKDTQVDMNITHAYKTLWMIVKLPSMKNMMLFLLTAKIGFSACDAVTSLKLVEAGIPKEKFAMIVVPMIPLQIILPIVISKYTSGPKPMNVYSMAIPYRLAFGLVAGALVWVTPYLISNGNVPGYYFVGLILIYFFHQICISSMFVASMAFFAKISDPAVGGTYMTFLNTIANLGGNWPTTAALWFVDALTFRQCSNDASNDCSTAEEKGFCLKNGGACTTNLDGYYIEIILCFIIGCLWFRWGRRKIEFLQARPLSAWKVVRSRS
ncbi:acetyl-coenzyme A transporter 1 [Belonocnema kinseyi]|uniref:acetyl-coenzyme A transporter 1 n=1 Tax=Belonocnema kinseyi TaxID=2817044 RepID=UPI00143CCFCD|nr:acetyl-coenzyme A transporter 1 [Belonocnema kinseyi]